jgi:hypothetical protein
MGRSIFVGALSFRLDIGGKLLGALGDAAPDEFVFLSGPGGRFTSFAIFDFASLAISTVGFLPVQGLWRGAES